MKTSILTALVLLPAIAAQAQTTPLWRDINATERNAQTKRTELIMYPTSEEALTKPFEQSPFYRSLNGEWDFFYTDDASTIPGDFSGLQWSSITVPGNWEFQGFGVPVYINIRYEFAPDDPQPPVIPEKVPAGVYRRTFTVPAEWEGRQLYLNLCGAKSGVYVYVNGAEVGYCEDSKDLARFDITSFVRDGENELTVLMHRWSAGSYLECQDFWRVSGFERDVYLSSEKSADYLDFKVVSTLAEDCTTGVFSFEGVQGSSFRLLDKDGSTVLEGGQRVLKAQIPDVRRWTAETPELYTLLVSKDGEYTRFDVGFRRIEIKGNVFYVNGQPIKFKGVNFHEHSQFTGHYLTRAEILANLKVMRQLNVNAIRTCHYPQGRAFYELCDSLGFYVYDEVNIESHGMG
ncbi:MAG: beta-galactosidase, partial [Bacteroidales bacterium]|nr:beta-galactosidase [Bacteroidales bacterium]